ncbi:PREDICTED: programmed cell death protein 10-like isoform X2 [Acropora digitifera]|uniref:programmed cell death protein 10-like n=1 Tax=Acropora palmata TaxID=6131 RepID=UPI00077A5361|nr:PREDICTED: programmed cell death protein 10-like isoform X2 [Acropora digitifera]
MALDGEESTPVPNLALETIVKPALRELEPSYDTEMVKKLGAAFAKAEKEIPGVTQQIVGEIMKSAHFNLPVNMNEILLLCAANNSQDYSFAIKELEFASLSKKAKDLKAILAKIPAEISNRQKFLQTIKDIATAIKDLLDAVNEVFKNCQSVGKMAQYKEALERNKKEFVKYSKNFSDTLKQYFKDQRAEAVYLSANRLINQTNHILYMFKLAGSS